MARNPRCDGVKFAIDTAAELSEPLPEPPQRLDECALPHWNAIVRSKRRSAWTPADLQLACQLARDLFVIEHLSGELERDGHVLIDARGKRYPHPAGNLLDAATRRAMASMRTLQIHAGATQGKADHQRGKNEAARDLAAKIDGAVDSGADLIARPA